ncbi:citrate:proton symporter [Phenylobacterium sp. LH3H17]|uniref:CitMHS family transporter n=1 Tax=Phenylobacterium sp. LH3H17 TaxID=2903901 RepID=UPI0020C9806B|nr:citrate:proton symporter [Phenylobacterium sp. LH3H17]UTP40266.1 citrate:proton symporter [Phenylobacterium sp. LH3H17]
MLTLLAFAMVASFMILIMTGRVSALVALIVTPVAFGLMAGFGTALGPMMLEGVRSLAPTGVMLAFAILYFGLMTDAGLFDPLVRLIVRVVHGDPVRIVVGSAVLALLVSMDGDGSTTYLICCTAMFPLYRRMGLNPLILACLLMLACGVTNITPWGGPTARAASALGLEPSAIFVPMIPAMLAGAAFVLLVAWMLGRGERRRLRHLSADGRIHAPGDAELAQDLVRANDLTERPRLIWLNAALTLGLLAALVAGLLPLPVLFMIASALALLLNYPSVEAQKARIAAHAPNILPVIVLIFAAGIFTGVLNGTGMTQAMAASVVGAIPPGLGPYMAPITALISMPFTFFISNDAFFFGILPILSQAAGAYGIAPEEMARAALTSQAVHLLSPLVPSTYLLVGLVRVELAQHQRFTLPWAVALSLVLLVAAIATGVTPFSR